MQNSTNDQSQMVGSVSEKKTALRGSGRVLGLDLDAPTKPPYALRERWGEWKVTGLLGDLL